MRLWASIRISRPRLPFATTESYVRPRPSPGGAARRSAADLRRPCGPLPPRLRRGDPGWYALLAHASTDALAPLLGASPGSGPPGSPNLSPLPPTPCLRGLTRVHIEGMRRTEG